MELGNLQIDGVAALAPMAGVTDRPFRELCASLGAAFVVSEMVSAKAVCFGDKKTAQLMELCSTERPAAIQLFGSEPQNLAEAAKRVMDYGPDWIDINMGCPVPKVSGNGSGSALMKTPDRCAQIVDAVKRAVPVPVTVKIRKGWDENSVNAVEVARACASAGADAVAVHARTRAQMYAPPADWEIIRAVKQAVNVPVIGNGDVTDAKSAAAMLEETGCDAVMVGRGALGNPWIFAQINAYCSAGVLLPPPGIDERLAVMARHIRALCDCKGESCGMREARKHVGWYLKGLRGAASFRREAATLSTYDQLLRLCRKIREENS
jgi:tRNA-dihydrouridine synthase B